MCLSGEKISENGVSRGSVVWWLNVCVNELFLAPENIQFQLLVIDYYKSN